MEITLNLNELSQITWIPQIKEYLIINKENESKSSLEKNINYSSQNISSFYFENNLAVQNGKRIFLIKWGNRSNVDNWRTNAVGSLNTGLQNENKQNPVKELKSYNNLPRSPKEKDSLENISNENFSKLGLYLYEYFNDKISSEEVLSKVELKGKVGVKEFLQSKVSIQSCEGE